jgi:hypothetical protein
MEQINLETDLFETKECYDCLWNIPMNNEVMICLAEATHHCIDV